MSTKTTEHKGWTAVDLDGTLAHYDGWKGADHIGEPVPEMVRKVKKWLAEGQDVRIFTARVYPTTIAINPISEEEGAVVGVIRTGYLIQQWSLKHLGVILPITCQKDYGMIMLYDDRCTYVFPNEGVTHKEHQGFMQSAFLDVATALGVTIPDGANFKDVADACSHRARVLTPKAEKADAALSLLDGCEDALRYVKTECASLDLARAYQQLQRALPLLRELAGREKEKRGPLNVPPPAVSSPHDSITANDASARVGATKDRQLDVAAPGLAAQVDPARNDSRTEPDGAAVEQARVREGGSSERVTPGEGARDGR